MDWVTVETFWSVEEAQLALSFLQAEEIPCRLDNLAVSSNFPHLANAAGGVKLLVAKDEADRAAELLMAAHQHSEGEDSSLSDWDKSSGDDTDDDGEDQPGLLERLRKFKLFSFLMVLTGG